MSTIEHLEEKSVWSISVKTFGPEVQASGQTTSREREFVVDVSPNDDLRSLYHRIENVTGLKASQQRLIYRGRLIEGINESQPEVIVESEDVKAKLDKELKIKDIVGLQDGHTIHLVPKRINGASENANSSDRSSDEGASNETNTSSSSAFLTSLLRTSSGTEEPGTSDSAARRTTRSTRLGSRRRTHYRLSSEDLEIPDAGSMEAVRQGMLTMHTILPPALRNFSAEQQTPSPIEVNRRWYIGQWIDCRDTVNHWLEATISDIVLPDEILPPRELSSSRFKRGRAALFNPTNDPVVTGTDFEGRRRLLLEPCLDDDSDDEGGELAGFRRRDNIDVQLLLVHYNGWPHRWDEWIRSDSERIRPFRVRTRHPASSSTALPTPQSAFADSPDTFIRHSDEQLDRRALLPELSRLMDTINTLLASTSRSVHQLQEDDGGRESGDPRLPWSTAEDWNRADGIAETGQQATRRQLEALSPLMDRLGRLLVDAAPHVASLAASMAVEESNVDETASASIGDRTSTLGGFFSLLNHDHRRSGASSEEATVMSEEDSGRSMALATRRLPSPSDAGSPMALSTTEERNSVSNIAPATTAPAPCPSVHIDPDFTDFATGVVNTTRGEVRSGPRSRRGQGDEFAGLLGAYLAAASLAGAIGEVDVDGNDNLTGLARLLRDRGTGTGGIDIHIHAVVTGPGGTGANGGVNVLGPLGGITMTDVNERALSEPNDNPATTFGNLFSSSRERRNNQSTNQATVPTLQYDEEDMGIFEELYSETPEPIDPSSLNPPEASSAGDSGISRWERSDVNSRASTAVRQNPNQHASRAQGEQSASESQSHQSSEQRRRRGLLNRLFARRSTGR
ncbi:hypothetical protein FisN_5Lh161 [Fistulifera solaris]|uniref:Ubiquitin-like domain-containing protein n=1 Tax=Fistulifera solaris TaxID=1519565 RepID=A0A1Z5JIV1_FISSO|nr:hypothetical protein FisN_5Lh161 [Fistulifera solaris]|eukprot:GAX13935.1 hypothetical protein FisN_5Lh161 [Fistulifera solaris]